MNIAFFLPFVCLFVCFPSLACINCMLFYLLDLNVVSLGRHTVFEHNQRYVFIRSLGPFRFYFITHKLCVRFAYLENRRTTTHNENEDEAFDFVFILAALYHALSLFHDRAYTKYPEHTERQRMCKTNDKLFFSSPF